MANAYRCDRCREFFIGSPVARVDFDIRVSIKQDDTTRVVGESELELCQKCTEAFKEFVNQPARPRVISKSVL